MAAITIAASGATGLAAFELAKSPGGTFESGSFDGAGGLFKVEAGGGVGEVKD